MLERSDYYMNIPPQDVSISGDILPVSDINGKDHPLRAEDAFYLSEFLCRIGLSNRYRPTIEPNLLFRGTLDTIVSIDAHTASKSKFGTYGGLFGFFDGDLAGLETWTDSDDFIDSLCSSQMNPVVSGLDKNALWHRFNGDIIRKMYWWLNIKSKCWKVLEWSSGLASFNSKLFISYVSGLNDLPFIRWTSSNNNPTPITETIISDADINDTSWVMQSEYNYGDIKGLDLQKVRDLSQTGDPAYIKRGGLLDDVEAVFRFNRTDITEFVALIEYVTEVNDICYKTVAVPFVKVSDTDWKVKIWDNAVAMSLLSYAGYDTSVINGGAVSYNYPTPSVYSRFSKYAYKVEDKANLPSAWNWSPSLRENAEG